MEVSELELGMQCLSSAGNTLSLYELTALQVALLTLQKKEGKKKAFFWGRIRGKQDDYYIAYTLEESAYVYPLKKFFFSTGRFDFRALPDSSLQKFRDRTSKVVLSGEPAAVVEVKDHAGMNVLTEADLLAYLVQRIDFATSAVPRGAHRLHGCKIIPAAEFKGLSFSKAESLTSWVHFRPADDRRHEWRTEVLFNTDFLEPLQLDVPKGSWVTRTDPISNCVTLRSLSWPGYVAYTIANSPAYGGAYFGDASYVAGAQYFHSELKQYFWQDSVLARPVTKRLLKESVAVTHRSSPEFKQSPHLDFEMYFFLWMPSFLHKSGLQACPPKSRYEFQLLLE
ncbi:hypothetical protein Efla_002502 [Eimeria flavescens]